MKNDQNLLVSRKFYNDYRQRIASSFPEALAAELAEMLESCVKDYVVEIDESGHSAEAVMIFRFMLPEISKAVDRSARCREAARRRKAARQVAEVKTPAPVVEQEVIYSDEEVTVTMPRHIRRELERQKRKLERKRRGSLVHVDGKRV